MRVYLTHCSKEKEPNLQGTDIAVTPDQLYIDSEIQKFMERCQQKNVSWAILSDLYGVYLSSECRIWYEKHPDTVTPQEEEIVIQDFNRKLDSYDEIFFFVRPESFHPFYERVLKKTVLADKVKIFEDVEWIEET
ncbi:MAG: hypothetical protein HY785_11590 [Oscillatoriophycideae cyanobacterium NC_groundwater_1537_Pr4_S-0.65um_50_18]|jgi:hypothetical protein|nr:hypothetical protein [Oscillatoriophycideae cyanobacterium NC_groundwater_1537_Pr4_S-0.65um_50_18]